MYQFIGSSVNEEVLIDLAHHPHNTVIFVIAASFADWSSSTVLHCTNGFSARLVSALSAVEDDDDEDEFPNGTATDLLTRTRSR